MPKSRGSNTVAANGLNRSGGAGGAIGSGGGTSTGGASEVSSTIEQREISDRLENRLESARTINVSVESRTRSRNEEVQVTFNPQSPGIASVQSESGSTYHVDYNSSTCDCMHFRVRGGSCRHIDAVNIARGQLAENLSRTGTGVGQDLGQGELEAAITSRRSIDELDEDARRALTGEYEDDSYFYSDHQEEFRESLERLSTEELPYEYHNVLNGSNNTFGIELEFVGGDADAIARELYDAGICAYDHRVRYHSTGVAGKWRLERDGSVSDMYGGGELVSPVLQDTPETWRNIEVICEVARRHGARIDYRCGAHVHMGMEPLDTARQRWRRFFNSIGSFEECIFRLSGGDLGSIRSGYRHYAVPFSEIATDTSVSRFTMNDTNDVDRLALTASRRDRYYGVNLTNIYDSSKPNTVEFRYFNGSLTPGQIQANVRIANGIMMAAEKARTKESESVEVSEQMKRRGNMLKETAGSNSRTDSQIMKFVDIFFTRKQDKDAILGVYGKNNWR